MNKESSKDLTTRRRFIQRSGGASVATVAGIGGLMGPQFAYGNSGNSGSEEIDYGELNYGVAYPELNYTSYSSYLNSVSTASSYTAGVNVIYRSGSTLRAYFYLDSTVNALDGVSAAAFPSPVVHIPNQLDGWANNVVLLGTTLNTPAGMAVMLELVAAGTMTEAEAAAILGISLAVWFLYVAYGLIKHLDEHIVKVNTAMPGGGSPDPNDPNHDPVRGWIIEIKAALKNLKKLLKKTPKNKKKRKPIEDAIKRAEDFLKTVD